MPFPRNKESEKVSSPPATSPYYLHVIIHHTLYFRHIHIHTLIDKIYTETFLFALKRMIKQQNFSLATWHLVKLNCGRLVNKTQDFVLKCCMLMWSKCSQFSLNILHFKQTLEFHMCLQNFKKDHA